MTHRDHIIFAALTTMTGATWWWLHGPGHAVVAIAVAGLIWVTAFFATYESRS